MSANFIEAIRAKVARLVQRGERLWAQATGQGAAWAGPGDATREATCLARLASPVASERWQAAAALGRSPLRSPEAVAALITALGDAEQFVAWQAAEALAQQEAGRVYGPLRAALADASPLRRAGAAEALGKLGGEAAVLTLIQHLGDAAPPVRAAVAAALGNLADPTSAPALLPLLQDADADVVRVTARALGQIGNVVAAQALAAALARPGQGVLVRRALAAALVRAGHPDAQATLLAALRDEDPQVRAYAARALAHVGAEEALEPLRGLLTDKNRLIRGTVSDRAARAIELLERRGRREGHPGGPAQPAGEAE